MVIELFGTPGSGKSYICSNVYKKYNIKDIMFFYKENLFGKILFHIFIKFMFCNKRMKLLYFDIKNIVGNKKYINCITNDINIDLYIKYTLFIYHIENKKRRNNIIVDEGIVHYCMAMFSEYNLEFDKCLKIIKYLSLKIQNTVVIFGVDYKKEEVLLNIKKRGRKRAPIDFLSDKKLINLLEKYALFVDKVKGTYDVNEPKKIILKIGDELNGKV